MEELYNNIENYLLGKLSKKEHESFKEQLQKDASLQEEVDAFAIARDAVENNIADKLRSDFSAWDKEEGTSRTEGKIVPMRNRWRLIAIAASVAVFSFIFMNWYSANQQFNSTSLAMSTYHESSDIANLRSTTGTETVLSAGLKALQQDNYSKAIEEFATINNDSEYYTDAQLLLSNAYFLNNQLSDAQTSLEPLLSSNNTLIKEKAEWLQILTLLKEGKKSSPEFNDALNSIVSNNNHSFFYQAKDLQSVLGRFWVGFVE